MSKEIKESNLKDDPHLEQLLKSRAILKELLLGSKLPREVKKMIKSLVTIDEEILLRTVINLTTKGK